MCASSCIKQYVQPSYGRRGMPVVAGIYNLRGGSALMLNVVLKLSPWSIDGNFRN